MIEPPGVGPARQTGRLVLNRRVGLKGLTISGEPKDLNVAATVSYAIAAVRGDCDDICFSASANVVGLLEWQSAMPTILIVDDDAAVRGILVDLLSDSYECNSASTAEEAFAYLDVENYDAVLTDIAMQGLTGVDLIKRIQLKDLETPVIVITGKGSEEDSELLMRLGAFAYVTKPFDLEQIEKLVERAVNRSNGRRTIG